MPFSINEFKAQLSGGGARPSLFEVRITNPVSGLADFKVPLMVKAAQIPGHTTGSYTVPYFGRQIKYGGDRTFEDWSVTVINDEDFAIRNAMEAWSNSINSNESNTRALPQDYKSDAQVIQYGKDQSILRQYTFQGLFPISIDPIELNWETQDTIEEFNITFQYDLWVVDGGKTGSSVT
jgi:hypothetical protein